MCVGGRCVWGGGVEVCVHGDVGVYGGECRCVGAHLVVPQ